MGTEGESVDEVFSGVADPAARMLVYACLFVSVNGRGARTWKDRFRTRTDERQARLARPLGCGRCVLGLDGFLPLVCPRRLSYWRETATDAKSTQIHYTRWCYWRYANLVLGRQG